MKLRALLVLATFPALLGVACAATVPRVEIDRCTLGVADGNDAMTMRQGAACAMVAKRLAADEQPRAALGYARKACDLEDPRGCEEYLALVRGQASLGPEELQRARTAGEKACSGMVVAVDGATDARPTLCARTAELYEDVDPRSPEDAGRLFASACKLGDDASCRRARALGVDPSDHVVLGPKARPNAPSVAQALPPPVPHFVSGVTPTAPPVCHEMRACVTLDVQQRNVSEVVGSIANHCDRAVSCTWCPAHRAEVERAGCHTTNLAPGEARAGRDAGLWYEGVDSIAYDCMDATDVKGCLAL
ncbi:MAG TPA: hypothetical protein VHS09_01695 [Polyangiaceae bacterium]|nr:hypothetical protein [Polyangiaceae bacterium]